MYSLNVSSYAKHFIPMLMMRLLTTVSTLTWESHTWERRYLYWGGAQRGVEGMVLGWGGVGFFKDEVGDFTHVC